jgi:hypothetical protein
MSLIYLVPDSVLAYHMYHLETVLSVNPTLQRYTVLSHEKYFLGKLDMYVLMNSIVDHLWFTFKQDVQFMLGATSLERML